MVDLDNSTVSINAYWGDSTIGAENANWAFGNLSTFSQTGHAVNLGAAIGTGTITATSLTIGSGLSGVTRTQGSHNIITTGDVTVQGVSAVAFDLAGAGSLTVGGSLNITDMGSAHAMTAKAATVTVTNNVNIALNGTLSFTTGSLTLGGSMVDDGTWTPGTGSVEFNTAAASSITGTSTPSFYNLRVATSSKVVSFLSGRTFNITGTTGTYPGLTTTASGCDNMAQIKSTTAASTAALNVTGSKSVQYTRITDLTASVGITANSSSRNGTTTGWTVNNCTITVSGTARTAEGGATWAGCNSGTPVNNISIVSAANAPTKTTTFCNTTTGAFTATMPVNDPHALLLAYMDSGGGNKGAVYTSNSNLTTSVTSIELTQSLVRLSAAANGAGVMTHTNATMNTFDSTQDADVPIAVDATPNAVTSAATEVHIDPSTAYDPGGTLTATSMDIRGTYKNNTAVDTFLTTITGSGSNTDCEQGAGVAAPLCIPVAGTKTIWNFTFTGTSNLVIDGNADTRFGTLNLSPASGNPTYTLGAQAGDWFGTYGNVTVGTGAAAMTANMAASSNLRVATRCASGAGSCGIAGNLTVNASAILGGTGNVEAYGNVSGGGTITMTGGTFYRRDFTNIGGSSNGFGATAGANQWTFNNLTFDNCESSATPLRTNAGGTGLIKVTNDFTVTGGTTLDATTNERNYDIDGSVTIGATSTLTAPDTGAFTIGNDFTNNGTFTPGTGQITFDTVANTSDLTYSAATTFYNLRVATGSKVLRLDETDQTNVTGTTGGTPGLTIAGGACGTMVVLQSVTGGDRADLNVGASRSIDRADVKDINAVAALTANNSASSGNNLNFTINPGACATTTMSITAGAAPTMSPSPQLPGDDTASQSTVHIVTSSITGYTLTAVDGSDTVSMTRTPATATLGDFSTMEPSAPVTWAIGSSGANGMFGLSVLSASGGRLAKWGAGSSLESDFATNLYLGVGQTTPTVLHTTATTTAGDDVVAGYRLNVPITKPSGSYSTTVTYTAVSNP